MVEVGDDASVVLAFFPAAFASTRTRESARSATSDDPGAESDRGEVAAAAETVRA